LLAVVVERRLEAIRGGLAQPLFRAHPLSAQEATRATEKAAGGA